MVADDFSPATGFADYYLDNDILPAGFFYPASSMLHA
jgi:hypothetical protein